MRMRPALILLGSMALLTLGFAGCSSNPLVSIQSAMQSAVTSVTTALTPTTPTTPPPINPNLAASTAALNQFAANNNLSAAQTAYLQNILVAGAANDQKAGLTAQQQQQAAAARLAVFEALISQNPNLISSLPH